MATRSYGSRTIEGYMDMSTGAAVAGVVYVLTLMVQFLGGTVSISVPSSYELSGSAVLIASLGSLVVAFATSETRDFEEYATWESIVVGASLVVILGMEYVNQISDLVVTNKYTQVATFGLCLVAWLIVGQ